MLYYIFVKGDVIMTIETKINIGDPALIYAGDSLKLGVCNCIYYNGVSIFYQFDVGDTHVKVNENELETGCSIRCMMEHNS